VNSIMRNWPVPLVTLYKLHASNPDDAAAYASGKRYECVDGQNRLCAIHAFRTGTPIVNDKGKSEEVDWEGTTCVKAGFGQKYATLPEENQEWFDTFEIAITVIQHPMSLDDRKAMFTCLQNGSKISSAEYTKNSTHPVSQFISKHGLRDTVLPVLKGFMAAASSAWNDMLVDCITLYINRASESPMDSLDRSQSELRAVLNGTKPATATYRMPLTEEDHAPLMAHFQELIALLGSVKNDKAKCHKFHVGTLFHLLLHGAVPEVPVIQAWMKATGNIVVRAKNGERDADIRGDVLAQLQNFVMPATAEPKRRAIPIKKRKALWKTYFGAAESGACQCCDAPILVSGWEQAHILAVANGGGNELPNLVPTCVSCNRSMGTENLLDWCVREYPRAAILCSRA
jgi:5-methylcytosine-specific restriction endonuclease McrA